MKYIEIGYTNEKGKFKFKLFNDVEEAFNFIEELKKINLFEIPNINLVERKQ